MTPDEMRRRTKKFAIDAIKLGREQPNDTATTVITRQLVRAATSVGANYRAACLAKSRADMANKLKIVEEESDESAYWLELLSEVGGAGDIESLAKEANELRLIVSASIKTLRVEPPKANRQS